MQHHTNCTLRTVPARRGRLGTQEPSLRHHSKGGTVPGTVRGDGSPSAPVFSHAGVVVRPCGARDALGVATGDNGRKVSIAGDSSRFRRAASAGVIVLLAAPWSDRDFRRGSESLGPARALMPPVGVPIYPGVFERRSPQTRISRPGPRDGARRPASVGHRARQPLVLDRPSPRALGLRAADRDPDVALHRRPRAVARVAVKTARAANLFCGAGGATGLALARHARGTTGGQHSNAGRRTARITRRTGFTLQTVEGTALSCGGRRVDELGERIEPRPTFYRATTRRAGRSTPAAGMSAPHARFSDLPSATAGGLVSRWA